MDNRTFENEALKTLTLHTELFPQANRCIASQPLVRDMPGQAENVQDVSLEVIWAGPHDAKSNCVICQLTSKDSSILNSYYAKVTDKTGKIVVQDRFVGFSRNIVFADMIVPKEIFDQCSVQMDMAMIGKSVKTASKTVPLDRFNVQDINAQFTVDAPKVNRAGSCDEIRISYYPYSSARDYDYVYPGRITDQMYFPSAGKIVLEGIELKGASGRLTISDGKRAVTCFTPADMQTRDSNIIYSFKELWEDTKLTDCFDLQNVYAKADYLLTIVAQDIDGYGIPLMITNITSLIEKSSPGTTKVIQEIDVYLDCFAIGTRIRMADGSQKAVENIRKGDLVKTPDGGQAAVREVRVQEDCQVIGIKLADGRVLSVTDGHAVAAADGIFPAFRLKEGQEVLTEEGTDRILQVIPHCERVYTVYALFLEGEEKWLYADGMKAHSSDGGDLFEGRDWIREDLPDEWKADYDNALKAGMLYGRQQPERSTQGR